MNLQQRPSDLDEYLDSLPMPNGPMPSKKEMISGMIEQLRLEEVDEVEIALFEGCSHELTDERLFKSTGVFWNSRLK